MAVQQVLGLWLSLTTTGLDANKPVSYQSEAPLIFYFATDTSTLYFAVKTAGAPAWTPVSDVTLSGGTIVLPDIPTADPVVAGALWSDAGTVKVSAGA